MDKARFARLQEHFQRAASLAGEARQAVLSEARAEDEALADQLEALLAREDRARATIIERLDVLGARHPEHAEALRQVRRELGRLGTRNGGPELTEAVEEELRRWQERQGDVEELLSTRILARIGSRAAPHERYRLEGEVGRGGMGEVLQVWDEDLRRPLAMKRLHRDFLGRRKGPGSLWRFLEEAQITGRLDHPGIVPVHELGLDAEGRIYFTMKLVQGEHLDDAFEKVVDGREGWSLARAVRVLLRVCEALAYAHDKGVLHRDLKPANVMVGRFGEVYVMDWGLARVQGSTDAGDLRPRGRDEGPFDSEVRDLAASTDSPLLTMEGTVIGTPAYMSPEQAVGKTVDIGPATDVYAIGAMLYRLLAGMAPYADPELPRAPHAVLARLLEGPPTPLLRVAPEAPPELVSICDKAMAREPAERYADPKALGDDLEAWLEGRVVQAFERGAWAEARKWILRNRGLAAALAGALVVALGGLGGITYVQAEGRRAAEGERQAAVHERNNVLRLSAFSRLEDLERTAATLWPPTPERLPELDAWLADARRLVAGLEPNPAEDDQGHLTQLAQLEALATPDPDAEGGLRFPDEESAWWHAELSDLVARIRAFSDPETGLMGKGACPEHGAWGVQKRRDWAASVDERTVSGAEAARRWDEARSLAADPEGPYEGLSLEPQRGFLPLGPDPEWGLLELWHPASGAEPERDETGRLVVAEGTGLVFVLVPGGPFDLGAQSRDPGGTNYDPDADRDEGPVHRVTLSPFLVSKYEMTQGQWLRLTGRNPSLYSRATGYWQTDLRNPVENVSWLDCVEVLSRFELELPTEAQWEFAARAGTWTVWATGDERDSLLDHVNLADQAASRTGVNWLGIQDWPELDDGFAVHAPVGSFLPNEFGLHDVHGNVWEWCRDGRGDYPTRETTDPYLFRDHPDRVYRGGGFQQPAVDARLAKRASNRQDDSRADVGLRPVCALR